MDIGSSGTKSLALRGETQATELVRRVVGTKWSLAILGAIRAGPLRPSELERVCDGISSKVLNQRLRGLVDLGVLERVAYAEVPPRVEYRFSALGKRLWPLLDEVQKLETVLASKR